MKFLFGMIFITQISMASTVPLSWVSEEAATQKSSAVATAKSLMETREYLDTVLGVQEKVLMSREDKNLGGFKFSHYITDFSVSRQGIFGLSAMKAQSSVWVKWQKVEVPAAEAAAVNNVVAIEDDSDAALDMTAEQIQELAVSSGKVGYSRKMRRNIRNSLGQIKSMMGQVELVNFPSFELAGMWLDLSFGANGKVWLFANAGAVVRVRIDWKKVSKAPATQALTGVNSKTSNFVNKVLFDLNEVYAKADVGGFKLNMVNVGVGMSQGRGFFGLGKSKVGFVGYLRFRPVPKPALDVPVVAADSSIATEGIEYVGEEVQSEEVNVSIPRAKFKEGLVKGLNMAKFFAASAQRFEKRWKVTELKPIFEVTKSGFLGLANTSSTGVIELELVRK